MLYLLLACVSVLVIRLERKGNKHSTTMPSQGPKSMIRVID